MNPIVMKSVRSRLRARHAISWGLIIFTVTAFVSAIVYAAQVEQADVLPADAARFTLFPVLIIQAVVLMVLGTGAVATGVAQEREDGLLDYQRLTPMRAWSKLLGYLFGLPVREYALFALTLPFLLIGVVRGGFPVGTVLHFYVIFFSAVFVYHMTGIVAGMVSKRPRQAGFFSQGMVLILYFVLPTLSHLGFAFFEFLTIRPALFGLIAQEIERVGGSTEVLTESALTALDSFRDIPFFGVTIAPAMYSLMVQGALLVTLWTVAHRRLRDDSAILFSKFFSVVFFVCVAVFTLGSVWPMLSDDAQFVALLRHFEGRQMSDAELLISEQAFAFAVGLLCGCVAVMGLAGLLCVWCATPDQHRIASECRRAARRGLRRTPLLADGSSALPAALVWGGVGVVVYAIAGWVAISNGRFQTPPTFLALALPPTFLVVLLVFLQSGYERLGARASFVSVFLLWMVPAFLAILVGIVTENETLSSYISSPFPASAVFLQGANLLRSSMLDVGGRPDIVDHLAILAALPVVIYGALAVPAALAARRRNRALMARAIAERTVPGNRAA